MFNLVNDAWVPAHVKGKTEKVSLRDLFLRSEEISGLTGTSIEKIAIIRLALCVAQAALKLETEDQWKKCRGSIVKAAVAYLDKWVESFNLYGDKAFLQVPWIKADANRTLDDLFVEKSSGNNHTLFDHEALGPQRDYTDAEIALGLVTSQQFKSGGLIRTKPYKWLDTKVPSVTRGEPSGTTNLLVTVLMGDNILDTLHLNLIPEEWINKGCVGKPIWEYGKFKRDNKTVAEIRKNYLTNLVPLTRGLVLHEGKAEMTLVDGFQSAEYPTYRDPMVTVKAEIPKTGSPFLTANVNKAAWRDLEGILRVPRGKTGVNPSQGVWAFRHLLDSTKDHKDLTVMVGALSCNKAKVEACLEWVYKIPAGMMGEDALGQYASFVQETERVFRAIRSAMWICLKKERNGSTRDNDPIKDAMDNVAFSEYWSHMGVLANRVIDSFNGGGEFDWHKEVRKKAYRVYEAACPQLSPEAIVNGQIYLERELHK